MGRIRVLLAVVLLAATGSVRSAPYVTATYTAISLSYRLDFTLHMEDQIYGEAIGWGLFAVGFSNLAAPSGWVAGADYRHTEWYTLVPEYYVTAGGTFYGCSAVSQTLPASLDYFIRNTGQGAGTFFGTLTPVPIPEPSSLLALGGGVPAMGLPWLRRRVRTRA